MSEWKKVKLGDCIKEINEKTTKNNQYEVLSVTKDGIFSQEDFFKKQIASKNNIGYKIIKKNNLVFSTMNLWMGSLDVLTNYEIGIVSPAYKIFEFNKKLMLPEYGDYYMKSYYMLEQYKNCSEQGASVVRKNLDLKALLNVEINIPSIKEQIRIVKLLKKLDLLIDKYEKLIEEKKQFIKNQFVNLVEKERVNIKKLDDLCDVITKQTGFDYTNTIKDTLMQEKSDTCLPYIQTKFFSGRDFNFATDYYIPIEVAKHYPKILLDNKCILLSIVGASIGNVGLFDGTIKAFLGGAICVAKPKNNINVDYLYYFLISKFGQKQIARSIKGSGQETVTIEDIRKFDIRLPDENIQSKIIQYIDILDKQKSLLEQQKQNYENLKKGLMQKLLTGKVRVKI